MGRELKRVALDFDWPLNKIWSGFINPYYEECKPCTSCEQTGYSAKARCARLGISEECDVCKGEGSIWSSPEAKAASETWEIIEPPSGTGYQMWETVSEGSPISPVFATPEGLASYLAEGKESSTANYEQWLKFINGPGWALSMVVSNGVVQSGVQAAVEKGIGE